MKELKKVKIGNGFMTWLFNEDKPKTSSKPIVYGKPVNKYLLAISKKERYEMFLKNNY